MVVRLRVYRAELQIVLGKKGFAVDGLWSRFLVGLKFGVRVVSGGRRVFGGVTRFHERVEVE